jgi:hypothetical protein
MLLCDAAQAVAGKLYILGAGWSQILVPDTPVNMALAVKLEVDWHQANDPHRVTLNLLDADGEQVSLPMMQAVEGEEEPQLTDVPVVNEVMVETGRPPGLAPGTSLDAPLVFDFHGLALPTGSYVWELQVNGEPQARVAFRVGPVQRR